MTSDSSDNDHDDEHFMDYPNCAEEDENQNVGLIVEDFKFTKGDKGKIQTRYCNPLLRNGCFLFPVGSFQSRYCGF